MRASRMLSATLSTALLLGCGAPSPFRAEQVRPPAGTPVEVVVTNMNWATIEVFAVASGQSLWLGMVETGRTETLSLPSRLIDALDLYVSVHPIGSRATWTSELLVLSEGATIELTVENALGLSHLEVRD